MVVKKGPELFFTAFICMISLAFRFAGAVEAADKSSVPLLVTEHGFLLNGKSENDFERLWWDNASVSESLTMDWSLFGWESGNFKIYPYLGYFHLKEKNRDAYIMPLGIETRWTLGNSGDAFQTYLGLGFAGYGMRFEDRGPRVDTGWGGRVTLGMSINRWVDIQAAYSLVPEVEDYDLGGFSLQGKIKIYF